MSTQASARYMSTALRSQYNVILWSGSALFSLASASIWPFVAGCALELGWLGLGSRLPAFRRRVDGRIETERRTKLDDEVMLGMRSLDPERTARLLTLTQTISMISLHVDAATADAAERAAGSELEQARLAFLRYCRLDERLRFRLEELELAPPEQEAARLSQLYAAEKDIGARLVLHQAIKAAQGKVEQQARVLEARRQIQLRLLTIEQALAHLRSQQKQGAPLPELLYEARAIGTSLTSAVAFEAELAGL